MKLEVINCTTQKTIKIYIIADLPMLAFFNFEEWKDDGAVVIGLSNLSNIVANLNPEDSDIQDPEPSGEAVDFYLPDPLKSSALSRFVKSQMEIEEIPSQFADRLREINEQISRPALRLSTISSAVVTEILQNHHPHSDYKVKISDG